MKRIQLYFPRHTDAYEIGQKNCGRMITEIQTYGPDQVEIFCEDGSAIKIGGVPYLLTVEPKKDEQ